MSRPHRRPNTTQLKRLPALQRLLAILAPLKGAEVFLVGGSVRDLFLRRPLGDLDVVVRGVPLARLQKHLAGRGKVNFVGKTFGVLKFTPKGLTEELDVALPRTEHAFGTGGTRDVAVSYDPKLPLLEDLKRRDFTINALAIQLQTGQVIDPGEALSDLAGERLRAVGNPTLRFEEDLSRILRGLRFAVELGFHFDDQTWQALKRLIGRLADETVPRELVAREFLKAFEKDPLQTIDLWDISGAFRATMPEVLAMKGCPQHREFHSEGDVWTHARLSVEMATSKKLRRIFRSAPTLETLIAVFLHDVGKPSTLRTPEEHGTDRIRTHGHDDVGAALSHNLLERLRFSSYEGLVNPARVAWLIRYHMIALAAKDMRPSTLERYFLKDPALGQELLKLMWSDGSATLNPKGQPTLTAFKILRKRLAKLPPRAADKSPLIRGDEILRAFSLHPGPQIGKLLDLVRDAQLAGKIRTRKEAFRLVKKKLTRHG